MEARRFADAAAFLDRAERFLLRHEVAHTVPLGVALGLVRQPDPNAAPPYLAVVEWRGEVVAAAVMTPPFNLLLSLADDPSRHDPIAVDLRDWGGTSPPGVLAEKRLAARFAGRWREISDARVEPGMAQRLFRLDRVRPVAGVPGAFRRAGTADRDLLIAWMEEFTAEALGHADPARIARAIDLRLATAEAGMFFWDDEEPVSMVGYSGATPNTVRVAPVYTPSRFRNRGYAGAATAAASQTLLDEGRRFCCLFTDLANPAANHLYQKIGYEPLLDVDEYRFAP